MSKHLELTKFYLVKKVYRGGISTAILGVTPPEKIEDHVQYYADTEMPGGAYYGYELTWELLTDPKEIILGITTEIESVKKKEQSLKNKLSDLEKYRVRLLLEKKYMELSLERDVSQTTVRTEWEMAIATNKHHFWCNFDPMSPVEDCKFCERTYKKYPPSKGADALMAEHFPDAIIRT